MQAGSLKIPAHEQSCTCVYIFINANEFKQSGIGIGKWLQLMCLQVKLACLNKMLIIET